MRRRAALGVLAALLACAPAAWPQAKPIGAVTEFKAQPLYRAVKLAWTVKPRDDQHLTFRIVRADTFADGPYTDVAAVPSAPGRAAYEYVDRSIGTEAKYHYKLIVKETGETHGPVSTRPYFSPPAT